MAYKFLIYLLHRQTEGTFTIAQRRCRVSVILAPDTKQQNYFLTYIRRLTFVQVRPHVQSFQWKRHVAADLARKHELMSETLQMDAQYLQPANVLRKLIINFLTARKYNT